MGMFDNYEKLEDAYIPTNIKHPKHPCECLAPNLPKKPYELYNIENQLIGYTWNYGDTVNLEFNIDGNITVMNDDIIYDLKGQAPTKDTIGYIGNHYIKAFNISDLKAWACIRFNDANEYTWIEIDYDANNDTINGKNNVFFDVSNYMEDKQITVKIMNFRHELIKEKTFAGSTNIIFEIDEELSKCMVKGTYYCSVLVLKEKELIQTITEPEDIMLVVK